MKKVLLFLLILFMPLLVDASSYSSATNISKGYINNFLNPSRYIKINSGDLISKEEVEKTIIRPSMTVSSYMYDGTKFWAKDKYVIGETIEKNENANVKTKVTEIVLHDTKVKGTGKYTDPWIFIDTYKVTLISNGNGTVSKGVNIEGTTQQTISVDQLGSATFYIKPSSGYKYLNNTCGSTSEVNTDKTQITIRSIEKDIICYVTFAEEKYSFTLKQPCKDVTTKKYGKRTHCFSNPVPQSFYAFYDLGYYRDANLKERLGRVTAPALTGWTFDEYYIGSNQLINNNGFFENSYKLLDEKKTGNDINFRIHENKYTVTLDHGSGATNNIGTTSVVATYDHDMPEPIVVPKKPGYVFIGYYKNTGASGDKYYNGSGGTDNTCEPWNQAGSKTIHAAYRKCAKGHYCATGNDETPCPVGTHQDEEGKTSCKPCPAGTYNNSLGQVYCTNCSPGYYQNETGKTSCKACGAGTYQNEEGKTSCKDCPAGRYNNKTGQAECACCPGGQYQGSTGQTYCNTCGAGSYSTGCAASCTPCSAGTYQPNTGQSSCPRCPSGTYQGSTGKTYCSDCPAGSYSTGGASSCTNCPAGQYQPNTKQSSCNNCPAGEYQGSTGKTYCDTCGANTYSTGGASSCSGCGSGYSSPAGSTSHGSCWRTKYTRSKYTRTKFATGTCHCQGYAAYGEPGGDLCSMESCYYYEDGTCTLSGCSCSRGESIDPGSCGTDYTTWTYSSQETVYGSCSADTYDLTKYLCSSGTTVYWPN